MSNKRECTYCREVKKIVGKGWCATCYARYQKSGKVEYKKKGVRKKCRVDDCEGFSVANGICEKHRSQLRRHGEFKNVRPDDWGKREKHPLYMYWNDTKRKGALNICDEWVIDFWAFVDCVKDRPSKKHYLRAIDLDKKLGTTNWQWVEGITDANRQIKNSKNQNSHDKKRARVSAEERNALLIKANNKCEICGKSEAITDLVTGGKNNTLCVDHNHETGELRGMLCRACNSGLGHFKDDIALLDKAMLYLRL